MTARNTRRTSRSVHGLRPRAAGVLRGVVQAFLRTGLPVSSEEARRAARLDISSATVRVVMGELTTAGLLEQPHTSAGRTPTARGLRVYVDRIMRPRGPSSADRDALDATLRDAEQPGAVVRAASRHLAGTCTVAAMARRPRLADAIIDHIELLPLSETRVLAVCMLRGGEVHHRVIRLDRAPDPAEIIRARNLFNARWSGRGLAEVRVSLRAQIAQAQRTADPNERLLALGARALPEPESADEAVVVEGRTHLLVPDVGPERASAVFAALDDKALLLGLLDRLSAADGPQVLFGDETRVEALEGCALICAPYRLDDRPLGAVAILGPVRMNYSRVIPWVRYTAEAISGILHARRAA